MKAHWCRFIVAQVFRFHDSVHLIPRSNEAQFTSFAAPQGFGTIGPFIGPRLKLQLLPQVAHDERQLLELQLVPRLLVQG